MVPTPQYGFVGIRHLFKQRVTEVGVDVVWAAVQETLNEYNRTINALMGSTVERSSVWKERVRLPGSGTLQPADEWTVARPVAPQGYYDMAWPMQGGATAWGTNRISTVKLTVEEANLFTSDAVMRDADWLRRHIMAATLDNVAWTYSDELHGDLTVNPLANNDSVVYQKRGMSLPATDNHYLGQAAAIDDSNNPFPTIHAELDEHPVNAAPYVAYVASNLVTSIKALSDFLPVRDPEVEPGISSDRINVTNLRDERIRGFGDEVIGRVDRMWIVEWKSMPDSYIWAEARGANRPLLRMREHMEPELQGFFPEAFNPQSGLTLQSFFRYAGFGIYNRVGAVMYYIGNATYAVPSAYNAPLAE